jgi:hypothetical protein
MKHMLAQPQKPSALNERLNGGGGRSPDKAVAEKRFFP